MLRILIHRHRAAKGEILDEQFRKGVRAALNGGKPDMFQPGKCHSNSPTDLGARRALDETLLFHPHASVLLVFLLEPTLVLGNVALVESAFSVRTIRSRWLWLLIQMMWLVDCPLSVLKPRVPLRSMRYEATYSEQQTGARIQYQQEGFPPSQAK